MAKNLLVSWIRDAHAMELALEPVLENHARDAEGVMPDVSARDRQHAAETRQHADRMRQALDELGESTSTMKSALSTLFGQVHGVSTGIFSDELMKNALSDYATEHFEIACYRSLVAAAEELGETRVAALCRANLQEDEEMARWVETQLPRFARETLITDSAGSRR
jgi:ferritin-like metal-binding protein YciE